jgi:hypothetical protein
MRFSLADRPPIRTPGGAYTSEVCRRRRSHAACIAAGAAVILANGQPSRRPIRPGTRAAL